MRKFLVRIQSTNVLGLRLTEKLADQTLLLLVFDPSEEFCAQPGDCLSLVEWQLIVDFASGKMAGHAT